MWAWGGDEQVEYKQTDYQQGSDPDKTRNCIKILAAGMERQYWM